MATHLFAKRPGGQVATHLFAKRPGRQVGSQGMKQLQDGVTSVLDCVVLLQQMLNHFLHGSTQSVQYTTIYGSKRTIRLESHEKERKKTSHIQALSFKTVLKLLLGMTRDS